MMRREWYFLVLVITARRLFPPLTWQTCHVTLMETTILSYNCLCPVCWHHYRSTSLASIMFPRELITSTIINRLRISCSYGIIGLIIITGLLSGPKIDLFSSRDRLSFWFPQFIGHHPWRQTPLQSADVHGMHAYWYMGRMLSRMIRWWLWVTVMSCILYKLKLIQVNF